MPSKPIFISHAVQDKKLVEKLINFLEGGIGVSPDDIFCSSIEGKGIICGHDFVEFIRQQLIDPELVILVITENYFKSKFCLAEMGAAWVKAHKLYPILVPPIGFDHMNAVLGNKQGVEITDSKCFDELYDLILSINIPNIKRNQVEYNRHKTSIIDYTSVYSKDNVKLTSGAQISPYVDNMIIQILATNHPKKPELFFVTETTSYVLKTGEKSFHNEITYEVGQDEFTSCSEYILKLKKPNQQVFEIVYSASQSELNPFMGINFKYKLEDRHKEDGLVVEIKCCYSVPKTSSQIFTTSKTNNVHLIFVHPPQFQVKPSLHLVQTHKISVQENMELGFMHIYVHEPIMEKNALTYTYEPANTNHLP